MSGPYWNPRHGYSAEEESYEDPPIVKKLEKRVEQLESERQQLVEMLLTAAENLDAAESNASTHCLVPEIRDFLVRMGLVDYSDFNLRVLGGQDLG